MTYLLAELAPLNGGSLTRMKASHDTGVTDVVDILTVAQNWFAAGLLHVVMTVALGVLGEGVMGLGGTTGGAT